MRALIHRRRPPAFARMAVRTRNSQSLSTARSTRRFRTALSNRWPVTLMVTHGRTSRSVGGSAASTAAAAAIASNSCSAWATCEAAAWVRECARARRTRPRALGKPPKTPGHHGRLPTWSSGAALGDLRVRKAELCVTGPAARRVSTASTWSIVMDRWSARFLILAVAALIWSSEMLRPAGGEPRGDRERCQMRAAGARGMGWCAAAAPSCLARCAMAFQPVRRWANWMRRSTPKSAGSITS